MKQTDIKIDTIEISTSQLRQNGGVENKKPNKKPKHILANILIDTFYVLMVGAISVCGLILFHNNYYLQIYVSGHSMSPTLNNFTSADTVDFGIADGHASAIDNVKRFDIVITYYPWVKDDTSLKIKRVWGLPGETISLNYNVEQTSYTYVVKVGDHVKCHYVLNDIGDNLLLLNDSEKSFNVRKYNRSFNDITLGAGEYYVMGDNWAGSSDCYSNKNIPLTRDNLHGVVVAIEGYATLVPQENKLINKVYTTPRMKI